MRGKWSSFNNLEVDGRVRSQADSNDPHKQSSLGAPIDKSRAY